jgi:metal-sulfur cluster biosynthetic enzyme
MESGQNRSRRLRVIWSNGRTEKQESASSRAGWPLIGRQERPFKGIEMTLTEKDVLAALRDCYDPELPVNIVDLGLVYAVKLTPDETSAPAFPRQRVEVDVTMTTQACPSHGMILEQVRNRLAGVPEISETVVNLVWEPAWTPSRISQEARERLGIG